MFVLEYKRESDKQHSIITLDKYIDSTDILSETVNELRNDIINDATDHLVNVVYPIDDILQDTTCTIDKVIVNEVLSFANMTQASFKNISDVICSTDCDKNDIFVINNINSRKQVYSLSNISCYYKHVMLIKPCTDNPFNENIYCVVSDAICDKHYDSKQHSIPFNIADILDLSLCMYSYMKYCINLALSITSDMNVNNVAIDKINLTIDDEYAMLIKQLKDNVLKFVEK